jgi:hypothetical protein
MLRTRTKIILMLAVLATFTWIAASTHANSTRLDAATIKAGLRTTPVEDKGFIDGIITMVNKGTLPADLVDSTFQWARKKPRYRFQYFKQALIVRAAAIGIKLSP